MPAKKKTRPNRRKPKTSAVSKKSVKKTSKKKSAVETKAPKKLRTVVATTNAERKKTTTVKTTLDIEQRIQDKNQAIDAAGSARARQSRASSGRQSGDLQGLSRAEEANSESVDELLEEGNPFEAEVVTGVEEADEADQKEVRTHEVPENDVPDEYLDKE
jgi:hypothetical protein